MSVPFNEFQWVVMADDSNDGTKLWSICNTFDVSVVGCDVDVPTPKRSIVDVPYRDGALSLTSDDDVTYSTRRVSLRLETKGTLYNARRAQYSVWNAFHGKTGYIIKKFIPAVDGYTPHFHGTMEVSAFEYNGSTATFSINMDAFPYNVVAINSTPEEISIYDTAVTKTLTDLAQQYCILFVAVEFDSSVPLQCSGIDLTANNDPDLYTSIFTGTQSNSVYNANLIVKKAATGTNNFVLKFEPISPTPSVLNAKIKLRYMVGQL